MWRRRGPPDELGQPSTENLVGLPGDGLAAIGASGVGLAVAGGDGRRQRLGSSTMNGLATLADGTLIEQLGIGAIRLRRSEEPPRTLFGLTRRLGRGDGGQPAARCFRRA